MVAEGPARSITIEEFVRGALALYAFTFGLVVLLITIILPSIVAAGVILTERNPNAHVNPTIARFIFWSTIIVGLILAAAVVWLFYWGTKSIIRGRTSSAVVFLVIIVALHILWTTGVGFHIAPINWFSASLSFTLIVVALFRGARLSP